MMPARRQLLFFLLLPALIHGIACGGAPKPLQKQPNLEDMLLVPEGEFLMGQDQGANEVDERPLHRVWLDAFYIDRTEVTNAQFKAFCDATSRVYPNNPYWDGSYFLGKPDHPVVLITYEQARAYCEWAGKRLPTEAEWEKAARGTDGRIYPWGNVWQEGLANLAGDDFGADRFYRTAPVGSLPNGASPYGALDMIGNVWEWCADWYDPSYYARSPQRNPQGPEMALRERVARGGSFSSPRSPTGDTTTHNRSKNAPNLPIDRLGCRCAASTSAH
jgi:formylglycine-generating enzyme required for sulfatase activity